MRLSGYRSAERGLLSGHWLPGELLSRPLTEWPVLAEPVTVPPPGERPDERLCLVSGVAFVRFCEIDWIVRRARLEIGLSDSDTALDAGLGVLRLAVEHAHEVLGLRRLHGWVTQAADAPTDLLADAGFRQEAAVPRAVWHNGAAMQREIWGMIIDG